MLRLISLRVALLLGLVSVLAGCGNASVPAAQPRPTGAAAGARPTDRPLPTSKPAPAGATTAPATAGQPAAPTASPGSGAAAPDGIPEGLTAEGYHYRGRADAPVTLVMYSDFL